MVDESVLKVKMRVFTATGLEFEAETLPSSFIAHAIGCCTLKGDVHALIAAGSYAKILRFIDTVHELHGPKVAAYDKIAGKLKFANGSWLLLQQVRDRRDAMRFTGMDLHVLYLSEDVYRDQQAAELLINRVRVRL